MFCQCFQQSKESQMLIVACIKQVPDTTQVKIDPVTNTLVREGIPFIVNPYDTHALEEALRLKEQFGCKVVAISMGPPNTELTLKKALALGVDRAILLSDRAFGGADTLATSAVLAGAIKKLNDEVEEVGLVLCGKQTIDGDTAQTGPGIASRLGQVQLTLVDKVINFDAKSKKIRVSRKLEGRHEIVESQMPAMLTVVRELNRPRYASENEAPRIIAKSSADARFWRTRFQFLCDRGKNRNVCRRSGSRLLISDEVSP
jgi:electron transfer flavoprotein beta subunit